MKKKKIKLTEEQREVVYSDEKNILVVAGAGTGKTRVLTERIKRLLEEGVDPESIVAITFTNLAANEIKDRLSRVEGVKDCFIGTIHGFANSILRDAKVSKGIFTDEKFIEIAEKLITRHCRDLTIEKFRKGFISKFEPGYDEYRALMGYPDAQPVSHIPITIPDYAREQGFLTFNDMLVLGKETYSEDFVKHLLVDEFQDVGVLEYSFLKGLKADNNFFVGDDWQSIYGFKGGDVNIMLDIYRGKRGSFKTYSLTQNFRSGEYIINASEEVIDEIENKIEKRLRSQRDIPGSVVECPVFGPEDLIEHVTDNSAIIVRSKKDLTAVKECLEFNGVSHLCVTTKTEMDPNAMRNLLSGKQVVLLTCHQAKGLEFDRVIIYGKNLPLRSTNAWNGQVDERKVMYVALTRAKDEVLICN